MFELDSRPYGIQKPEYRSYCIIQAPNKKFGIINKANGAVIVDCLFDDIQWLDDLQMIRFYSNRKSAICKIHDLENIAFSIP